MERLWWGEECHLRGLRLEFACGGPTSGKSLEVGLSEKMTSDEEVQKLPSGGFLYFIYVFHTKHNKLLYA